MLKYSFLEAMYREYFYYYLQIFRSLFAELILNQYAWSKEGLSDARMLKVLTFFLSLKIGLWTIAWWVFGSKSKTFTLIHSYLSFLNIGQNASLSLKVYINL
jgi:hypothetical protein